MDTEGVDRMPLCPAARDHALDIGGGHGEVDRALGRLVQVTELAAVDEGILRARRGRFGEPQRAASGGSEPALPGANTLQFEAHFVQPVDYPQWRELVELPERQPRGGTGTRAEPPR